MKTFFKLWAAAILLCGASGLPKALAEQPKMTAQGAKPDSALVERGRYLVEGVAMCTRCHTYGNQAGEADRRKWLGGGALQILPTYPVRNWAIEAPRIGGGPPGTDEEFIRLLTTGISRTGAPPKPPMPPFRMTRADAEAVLAYLKSIKLN